MKIVVKIGTQSILSAHGVPSEQVMRSVAEQITALQHQGHKIVLVSSGAVGFGRKLACNSLGKSYGASIVEKQVLASLGQHQLMHMYTQLFAEHGVLTSQLLLTKQDFYTRQHYLNVSRLITEILAQRHIMPIVNENDTVAIEELMFTDNDELAGLIAAQIGADKLIVLSHIDGVYTTKPQGGSKAQIITTIRRETDWPRISGTKSIQGRGGMISKLNTARKVSRLGIVTHIASIQEPQIIKRLVTTNETIGTTVLASAKKSNIKRWIAYATPKKVGKITVNEKFLSILQDHQRVVSILPVGIKSYCGDFSRGDVVEVCGPNHRVIGMGIVRYGADRLGKFIGHKKKPALIHYDYLHIF